MRHGTNTAAGDGVTLTFSPHLVLFVFCVCTASEDSTVKLWDLPGRGLSGGSMGANDAVANLTFNCTAAR